MTGRKETVPDPERRRAASAALTDSMEEVCRHYAPSGPRAGDCWEVREDGGGVSLGVFLAGAVQGWWTDAATDARGDALDLVARLRGLDAAGALAEAERFLGRNAAGPEPKAGDAGEGQMALFQTLPESGGRKRPARRFARCRKPDTSRRAAMPHEPSADAVSSRPGGEPESAGDETGQSRRAAEARAPGDGKKEPTPPDTAQGAGPGPAGSRHPVSDPGGVSFTAEDRQRIRKMAEDVAWLRSRQTVRSLDARAHERAKARKDERHRRWHRSGLKAAGIVALAVSGLLVGVMGEYRYGVMNFASVLGAERPGDAAVLPPDGNGG